MPFFKILILLRKMLGDAGRRSGDRADNSRHRQLDRTSRHGALLTASPVLGNLAHGEAALKRRSPHAPGLTRFNAPAGIQGGGPVVSEAGCHHGK